MLWQVLTSKLGAIDGGGEGIGIDLRELDLANTIAEVVDVLVGGNLSENHFDAGFVSGY